MFLGSFEKLTAKEHFIIVEVSLTLVFFGSPHQDTHIIVTYWIYCKLETRWAEVVGHYFGPEGI